MPLTIHYLVNVLRYSHLRGENSFDDCTMCPARFSASVLCHKYATSVAGKVNIEKSCGGVSLGVQYTIELFFVYENYILSS